MIVKDIRYIIKRIIIGVGIALILMLIKGNLLLSVNALQTISSYDMGAQTIVVSNVDRALSFYTNDTPWANQGDGYITFTFSITKVLGASTSPNVQPRFVTVTSGQQAFACNVGSTAIENSTFNSGFYSATCPVYMTSSGLGSVNIGLQDNQQNNQASYRVYFQGWLTFEQSLNNTLNNISYNNNINSQNIQSAINSSSQSIINNQNSNTQSMITYQNQNAQNIINNQNQNSQALQNTLNDTSTTQANTDASDFFGNFSSNSHGLSGIISSPLRLIQSISSSTCSALTVPLPFVNQDVSLPCMSTIYTTHFNTFLVLYRLITTGLIGYWVCVRLFSKVKDFQNPDNDRIEVLDL